MADFQAPAKKLSARPFRRGMRKRKELPEEQGSPPVDVAALVDVSFLLLIYFLVSSTLVREADLSLGLPGEGIAASLPDVPVLISLSGSGEVRWGGQLADEAGAPSVLPGLAAHLEVAKHGTSGTRIPVMLEIADEVHQQRAIDVLNCLHAAGIDRVALVEPPGR